jgi:hypothetical protein
MIPALNDDDMLRGRLPADRIDQSIFLRDPPRPIALEAVLQGLGLAEALKRVALDVFDENVDLAKYLLVVGLPLGVAS